jgi:AbrB family looped-hinge helix DNA binding protein
MKVEDATSRSDTERARVDPAGRIVLPARFRKSLGLRPGDPVTVTLESGTLRIRTARAALEKAQALMRSRNPRRRSAVAELIEERRKAATAE